MVVEYMLSLRASAHTGVAIPRLEGKCTEKNPKEWEIPQFLVVIVTRFLSTGGLPHHLSALVRNDRKFGVSPTNTNLPACGFLPRSQKNIAFGVEIPPLFCYSGSTRRYSLPSRQI